MMEWKRSVRREAGFRRCLILCGNVRDVWQTSRRTNTSPRRAVREHLRDMFTVQGTWDRIDGLSFPTSSQLSTFNDLVQGSALVEEDGDDYDIDFGDETQNDGGAAAGAYTDPNRRSKPCARCSQRTRISVPCSSWIGLRISSPRPTSKMLKNENNSRTSQRPLQNPTISK